VKVFVKMRDKKAELAAEFKAADDALQFQMDAVKRALLDYCKENGVESARTEAGMFYRTVRSKYWTNDWERMGAFIVEHKCPDLLEKRIHQGNMQTFLQDNPDLRPAGLSVDSEYTITVKKGKG
jgi:ATP-dependent Lon protease